MLGPKNPLLLTTVVGFTKGTVSAMKCAVVIAPYRRWANTATMRIAISRWIVPPGRNRSATHTALARSPRTVADADAGENGPGSASDRFVAKNVGKRGSIGVSNSPLSPAAPAKFGLTPSSLGASTEGRSWMVASRQGSDITRLPTVTRPRTASAKSSMHSPDSHAGRNPHSCRNRERSMSGAPFARCSSPGSKPSRTTGRPRAAAICRKVTCPAAARLTGPLSIPPSTIAWLNSRSASSRWTTCMRGSLDRAGNTGSASIRRTQLSTLRPRISAERITTHSVPASATMRSTWALSWPSTVTGVKASCSALGAPPPP